jgi:hypothetical protein
VKQEALTPKVAEQTLKAEEKLEEQAKREAIATLLTLKTEEIQIPRLTQKVEAKREALTLKVAELTPKAEAKQEDRA